MVKAIVFDQPGDSSVLKQVDIQLPEPKGNEILIKHNAIEVNIIDILQRKGIEQIKGNILGCSAAGIVEAMGPDVKGFEIGSKVAFATKQNGGAYAEKSVVSADLCFALPQDMTERFASASLAKGFIAHMLTHRVYIVRPNHLVLIHAVDTALGGLMCQWAIALGGAVIGTIGNNKNKEHAEKLGCAAVVNHRDNDWAERVMSMTKGYGVHCVYDPFGKRTFEDSLKCITPIGIMVSYANLDGKIDTINPKTVNNKSIFLTFPNLFDYKKDKNELLLSFDELVINLSDKTIRPTLSAELPLSDAAKAHDMIESGEVTGSVVLIP